MRVAFFTNAFPMMSEPFIALSAASLIDRGHEVDVFGLSNVTPTGLSSGAAVAERLRGRACNARWPQSFAGRLKGLPRTALELAGQRGMASLPLWRPHIYRRGWSDLTSLYQAQVFTGSGVYDILHCQFATLAEYVLKHRRAGLVKGRLVVHFRGYDISEVVHSFGPRVYDYLWQTADRFVANCDYFRNRAIDLGCPADRIHVVGSGIDLKGFEYRQPLALGKGAVQCLTVGRLTPRKGMHVVVEALRRLISEGLDIRLNVVGDGEQRADLEAQVRQSALENHIAFLGARRHSEIHDLLKESHIFIAASMTTPSGGVDAPVNTIKEALAVGVPTCAARHGGIPELVEDGVTGVLAQENDAADLAAALKRLLSLQSQWPAMAERGRQRVERDFAIDITTDKLLRVYDLALSGDPSRAVESAALSAIH